MKSGDSTLMYQVKTDEHGFFTLGMPEPGSYDLDIRIPGSRPFLETVLIPEYQEGPPIIIIHEGPKFLEVTIRILTHNRVIPDAINGYIWGRKHQGERTIRDGTTSFHWEVPPGEYYVLAHASGYGPALDYVNISQARRSLL